MDREGQSLVVLWSAILCALGFSSSVHAWRTLSQSAVVRSRLDANSDVWEDFVM
jgi:hypothetical protein